MDENGFMARLTGNAIDFLKRAIDEFESQPKWSIINFYTAVELLLKARLLHEHWSLIVSKNPDRKKFEAGDFVSVGFDEACTLLEPVRKVPLDPSSWGLASERAQHTVPLPIFRSGS